MREKISNVLSVLFVVAGLLVWLWPERSASAAPLLNSCSGYRPGKVTTYKCKVQLSGGTCLGKNDPDSTTDYQCEGAIGNCTCAGTISNLQVCHYTGPRGCNKGNVSVTQPVKPAKQTDNNRYSCDDAKIPEYQNIPGNVYPACYGGSEEGGGGGGGGSGFGGDGEFATPRPTTTPFACGSSITVSREKTRYGRYPAIVFTFWRNPATSDNLKLVKFTYEQSAYINAGGQYYHKNVHVCWDGMESRCADYRFYFPNLSIYTSDATNIYNQIVTRQLTEDSLAGFYPGFAGPLRVYLVYDEQYNRDPYWDMRPPADEFGISFEFRSIINSDRSGCYGSLPARSSVPTATPTSVPTRTPTLIPPQIVISQPPRQQYFWNTRDRDTRTDTVAFSFDVTNYIPSQPNATIRVYSPDGRLYYSYQIPPDRLDGTTARFSMNGVKALMFESRSRCPINNTLDCFGTTLGRQLDSGQKPSDAIGEWRAVITYPGAPQVEFTWQVISGVVVSP